jgi:hypothetical protein
MSTHRADGIRDAQAGRPPAPPAAPWKSYEQAIQAEYMDGYNPQTRARIEAEQAARDFCTDTGHRAHLIGHSRARGAYIETQDAAGQWRPFWQELKQEPTT